MPRPIKTGLDYFPLDTSFDDKLNTFLGIFGNDGLSWIITFWQSAYRDKLGRVNLSKYFAEVFAKNSRNTIEKQNEFIKLALDIGLIEIVEPDIYSSQGIQRRISSVSKERSNALKRYYKNKSKVKKSKVKDFGITSAKYKHIKSVDIKEVPQESLNRLPEGIAEFFKNYFDHRKQKEPMTTLGIDMTIKELFDYSEGGNPEIMKRILAKAIASGWKSIHPLDKNELDIIKNKANPSKLVV